MSTDRRYRSSFEPRELTETEVAVHDRVDSFLKSPPLDVGYGVSLRRGYDWMKEDMAMRSAMTQEIAAAQAMSYEQSARLELDNQAKQQQQWDADTVNELNSVRDSLANGTAKNWDHGVSQSIERNPSLLLNPRFMEAAAAGRSAYVTDDDAENQEMVKTITRLGNEMKLGNAEIASAWYRANPDKAKKLFETLEDTKLSDAEGAGFLSRLNSIKSQAEFEKAQDDFANFKKFGDDGNNENAAIAAIGSFDRAGMKNVEDPSGVMNRFKDSDLIGNMLHNSDWLSAHFQKSGDGSAQKFEQSLNTYMRDGSETPEGVSALNEIRRTAGAYQQENQEFLQGVASRKKMVERFGPIGEQMLKLSKEITDVAVSKDMVKGDAKDVASADMSGKVGLFLENVRKTAKPFLNQKIGNETFEDRLNKRVESLKASGEINGAKMSENVAAIRGILNDTMSDLNEVNPDPVNETPDWSQSSTKPAAGAPKTSKVDGLRQVLPDKMKGIVFHQNDSDKSGLVYIDFNEIKKMPPDVQQAAFQIQGKSFPEAIKIIKNLK